MRARRLTLVFAAAAGFAGAASAAEEAARLFARLDLNGDGILSSEEMGSEAALRSNWIAVDRNRDGRIRQSEFGTVPTPPEPRTAFGATRPPRSPEDPGIRILRESLLP